MLGLENLRAHKLRSLLTMLGMIFGVAAVVAMLSIGAGAQQEVMAFIEQLGVRNLIVEAREAADEQSLQKVRKLSPGLSFKDLRVIQANLDDISAVSARKRFTPTKLLPRPIGGDMPTVYGVSPAYTADRQPSGCVAAASSTSGETVGAAPVAVLGEAAAATLFGADDPVGQLRQGQRAVVSGDRRRRPAADRAVRRRRPAGAGSQQPDLRPAVLIGLPARGRPELAQGRDRRRLPADADRAPTFRRPPRCCAASSTSRTAAPGTSRSSRRPSCWPSSGARSASSRWSWWRSRRSRCWSAASAS